MKPATELNGYLDAKGRLTQFPGKKQKKKVMMMLEYLSSHFVAGRTYTESEVNDILNAHHTFNDPAILRRLLFVRRMLDRTKDGRAYWKNDQPPAKSILE